MKLRVVRAIANHAITVSTDERAEWIRAMTREMEHLPPGVSTVGWALSCMSISYSERIRIMIRSLKALPRWILVLEMLLFFLPLTLLCAAVVRSGSQGGFSPQILLLYFSGTVLGPLGLLAAFATLFLKRDGLSPATIAALGLLTVWNVAAYTAQIFSAEQVHLAQWWREFVLIAILPTLAVLHLVSINSSLRASPVSA